MPWVKISTSGSPGNNQFTVTYISSTDDLVTRDMQDRGDDRYKYHPGGYQHPNNPGQPPPRVAITMPDGGDTDRAAFASGKMSSVRRTFCLFVTFDLGLTFILWVIYTQLIGDTGWKAFSRQVENYTFQKSLFDTVMIAAVRFTFLLLAYALFRIRHWWTVAITTFSSSAFLLTKVFLFDFGDSSKNPLSYCLLIVSFVLAWVETWFLDFKVLPWERKELQRLAVPTQSYGSVGAGDRRRLLPDDTMSNATFDQYYSPVATPEGSDTEEGPETGAESRAVIPQNQLAEYRQLADKSWNFLWHCLNLPFSDWKLEAGRGLDEGIVYSLHTKEYGKIFKLEGEVEMEAQSLWKDMIHNINDSPTWNPTLVECSTVQVIDDHMDITHNIAAGIGGIVSSRDFVNLRCWGTRQGIYLSAGHGVTHPDRPPLKKHVRGFNGPGGWAFKPVENDPNKCVFVWVMNLDLKGWIPQRLVDQASTTVLLDYLKYVRQYVAGMQHK
ncbi:stAR-related lipid transfer protein 3-like isoform X2 [Babylonia areolata]|uniref:stAR-related lipid transfer protein 3-like isoform X2 n=1 Tax=Babylonia areolata TaxID=304850 RepID=UPI003FD0E09B